MHYSSKHSIAMSFTVNPLYRLPFNNAYPIYSHRMLIDKTKRYPVWAKYVRLVAYRFIE